MRPKATAAEGFWRRLEAHGTECADRIALEDGKRIVTYGELPDAIRGWQSALDELGARRVAFRLPNGIDWATLDLALLMSDRIGIPVPDFFSHEQQQHLLRTSGADTLVTTSGTATLKPQRRSVPPAGTAKITFTSGSTGTPKGVCLAAATMIETASALVSVLGPLAIHRHLSVLPLSLLLENIAGLYAGLLNGSSVALPALGNIGLTGSSQLDVERFVDAQHRYQPESMVLVPQLLLALTAAREHGTSLPERYRFIAVGGAKVAPLLLARARDAGLPVYEGYGLSECGSVVTLNHPGADRLGSAGQPLPHVALEIRSGEVVVASPRMLGYLGSDAADGDDEPIVTGDLGTLSADNYLTLRGRRDNLFATSFGRNLSPEWVESELQAEFEIGLAIVLAGEVSENVALIGPRMNADPAAIERAVSRCNARLPDYARIVRWRTTDVAELRAAHCLTADGRPRRKLVQAQFAKFINPSSNQSQASVS